MGNRCNNRTGNCCKNHKGNRCKSRRVAVRVVRIVIPRVKAPPETVDKDKHAVVIKVSVMLVPIAMPVVRVMPLSSVVLDERLTVCC